MVLDWISPPRRTIDGFLRASGLGVERIIMSQSLLVRLSIVAIDIYDCSPHFKLDDANGSVCNQPYVKSLYHLTFFEYSQ